MKIDAQAREAQMKQDAKNRAAEEKIAQRERERERGGSNMSRGADRWDRGGDREERRGDDRRGGDRGGDRDRDRDEGLSGLHFLCHLVFNENSLT